MTRLPLWIISFSAAWILFLVMGLRQGFGLFLPPLASNLQIDRATFGFGIAVSNLLWGFGAPLAGAIADRYGPGRVAAGGGLIYAGGLILMAMAAGANDYLVGNLLVGVGLSAAGFSVVLAAAGKAAPVAMRARVMAIASMGGSLGQFLMIPLTQWVIQEWGWSAAYLVLALLAATIVPFARAVAGIKVAASETRDQTLPEALAEAFRVPSFWLLTIGFFVCGFQLNFISTHMPAYLVDNGLSPSMGAAVLATIGLTNIFGTYLFGRMGERLQKKSILGWLYFGRGVLVVALLTLPLTPTTALVFAVGMGITWLATIPLTGGLVATFFGPQYMATLYGFVFFGHQLGASCGALIGGLVFDASGSYTSVWWASAALCFIGAAMHWAIVERPVARLQPALAA
jgi:predicted MFS family arabinose efflux permease